MRNDLRLRPGRLAAAAIALLVATGCGSGSGSKHRAAAAGPPASSLTASSTAASSPPPSTSSAPTSSAPTSSAPTQPATRTAGPSPTTPARVSPTRLATDLAAIFGAGTSYSVAAVDLTTGHTARAGAGDSMVLASLVKLDILETLLYQRQLSGQQLTDGQRADVERMIEHSDNGAADRLFRLIGRESGMGGYNAVLGLNHTILNTEGLWGLSTTSADDQLILLRALASAGSPLTATSRGYALSLMGQVESDQRWGVSAAADSGSSAQVKNGWLGVDDDRGRWAVNSGGIVRVGGHQVLMAVLSQHQPDFSTGVNRVQRAAVELAAAL